MILKLRHISLTLIISVFTWNITASGQLRNALFNNYSINEGLPDNVIHCIFQDSKGWIWIGTSFGVVRYDGYSFTKFQISVPECDILSGTLVRTIFEDKNGVIWIGTENQGIFLYNRKNYSLTQIKSSDKNIPLPNNSIWAITSFDNNIIWIGTENGLLSYNLKKSNCKVYNNALKHGPSVSNNFIRAILADGDNVWIGSNDGIDLLNLKTHDTKKYLTNENLSERENEVWKIYKSSDGQIWAGTYLDGLKRYNKETDRFEKFVLTPDNDRARTVRAIMEDNSGNMWIGTRGGLYSFNVNSNQTNHYEHDNYDPNGLIHNSILEIFKDKKGDLWIGTRDGISYFNFDKQAFGYLSTGIGSGTRLNSNEVYSVWEDDKNKVWIGTEDGGINIFDPKNSSIKYLTKGNPLSSNCIKSMCPDGKGNLLVGTYLGGLNSINLKTGAVKFFYHDSKDVNSISGNAVWSIARDQNNKVWIGTDGGLDLFNPETGVFTHFGEKFGLQNIVLVYVDTKNRLWLYHENVKMVLIENGIAREFPYKARTVYDDGENIWLGTLGSGLVKLNVEKVLSKKITTEHGLASNFIYGILPGDKNHLWLSTKNGISRFDKVNNTFTSYSIADGLLNEQFNYGAFLLCHDNILVFGGKKGADFIFAKKLRENTYNPNVVFTDFKIFNKSVPIQSDRKAILRNFISETHEIRVPYNQNIITFEFAALNFSNSSKNKYSYKLKGFNNFWNDVKNQRTATYTNLEPGEYTLIVRGSNNDGVFSKKIAKIKLTIIPPFYKTWLFRILMIITLFILGFSIFIFISNREKLKNQLVFERQGARKMQELERLKHQFFMNISHEIRTPLSLIVGPLEKISFSEMDKETITSHLNIVKRNANSLMKLVNQLLDYKNLETGNIRLELKNGNISDFIKNVVWSFKNLASEKKIELKFQSQHENIFTLFDPDKIEKIVNNLISNAVKFTPEGGSISVSLSTIFTDELDEEDFYIPAFEKEKVKIKQFVQISVSDTGIGIPVNQIEKIFDRFTQLTNRNSEINTGSGIGLNLIKELVKIHNGFIKVKSKVGRGSRFIVLIPNSQEAYNEVFTNFEELNEADGDKAANDVETVTGMNPNIPLLLIADDNSDIRTFIRYHFEPVYNVIDAADGQEAWEKVLAVIPDIVIADIMMPLMDGYDLCRKIKHDERTSHIPVVMLTALASKEKQISGIDVGADDYVTKPFDVSLLKAKIDNILSIRKALRERYSKELLLKPKDVSLTSPDEKFLKKVIAVIEKNISNSEFDIDNFAYHVGVSRTQLYRKIAALTDMSAKEFVRDIRLKRAAQLILQDKLAISDIALEVGFNDLNHFRKCFKEKFGKSASEYLKDGGGTHV